MPRLAHPSQGTVPEHRTFLIRHPSQGREYLVRCRAINWRRCDLGDGGRPLIRKGSLGNIYGGLSGAASVSDAKCCTGYYLTCRRYFFPYNYAPKNSHLVPPPGLILPETRVLDSSKLSGDVKKKKQRSATLPLYPWNEFLRKARYIIGFRSFSY